MTVNKPTLRPRPRQSRKKRRIRITLISVAAVLVLLVGGVGWYVFSLSQKFESAETLKDVFPDEALRPKASATGAQNILLLGSDTRGKITGSLASAKGERSDTMMVVHISADRKDVEVMSITRDDWVEIPGHGEAKVNAALAYGGVPLVVQTVEGLIDSRVDHVAVVDFQGFKGITDALGGVTIDNPIAFTPRHLKTAHFSKGLVELNGEEALAFVRERYAFSDGDFQRVRNQQLFIKAVMKKTLTRETMTNPATISNLVGAIVPFMAVDKGLDSAYAAGLALDLRDLRADDVKFFTLPTLGTGTVKGQSIVRVDFDKLAQIKEHFKADTLSEFQPEVQTMNGGKK